jgi:hypothetical protein
MTCVAGCMTVGIRFYSSTNMLSTAQRFYADAFAGLDGLRSQRLAREARARPNFRFNSCAPPPSAKLVVCWLLVRCFVWAVGSVRPVAWFLGCSLLHYSAAILCSRSKRHGDRVL